MAGEFENGEQLLNVRTVLNDNAKEINRLNDTRATLKTGLAVPGIAPDVSMNVYDVDTAGIYPLFGNLQVTPDDLDGKIVEFRRINGVWSKYLSATKFANKKDLQSATVEFFQKVEEESTTRESEVQLVNSKLDSISSGTANATPSTVPTQNISTYNAEVAATYPNHGGLVVTAQDLASGLVQLRRIGTTWSKAIIPINLAAYPAKTEIVKPATKAEIRAMSGEQPYRRFYTTDKWQRGNWYYDPSDTVSQDNGGTVLVTADGKRFKNDVVEIYASEFDVKGDNSTDDRANLQKALNWAAQMGGGKVILPWYMKCLVTVNPQDPTYCISLPSNVSLVGGGTITLKEGQSLGMITAVIHFGDYNNPSSNNTVDLITVVGNHSKYIGLGKYVQGISSRTNSANNLKYSENITISHCTINDTNIPVSFAKASDVNYSTGSRQAARHRRLRVFNNTVNTCANKMIEFAECYDFSCYDNYGYDLVDGIQPIFGSSNGKVYKNTMYCKETGLNLTGSCNNITFDDNTVNAIGQYCVGFIVRSEPTVGDVVSMGNIKITNNTINCPHMAFAFGMKKEIASALLKDFDISGNAFNGLVRLSNGAVPETYGKTTLQDIVFDRNRMFELQTVANEEVLTTKVIIKNSVIGLTNSIIVKTKAIEFKNITWKKAVTCDASSSLNKFIGCTFQDFVDSGLNNIIDKQTIDGEITTAGVNPITVTFAQPFLQVPRVFLQCKTAGQGRIANVSGVTATGFTMYMFKDGLVSTGEGVMWSATGILKS